MKYHIALLWLSSLVNSSTQEVDEHTPVTTNTEKHGAKGRRSQQSKTLFFCFFWKMWEYDCFSTKSMRRDVNKSGVGFCLEAALILPLHQGQVKVQV